MKSYTNWLEDQSIYMIREAYARLRKVALLWSMGKDSTALLWLIRKAFFGKIPFPVIHIDTTFKFNEIYRFRHEWAKAWGLNLLVAKNEEALHRRMNPSEGKLECCTALKTAALKQLLSEYGFSGLYLAIRRDEHGVRAKERFFSPRDAEFTWDYKNQPPELWSQYKTDSRKDEHIRIHPLLNWREVDVWEYIRRENIPVVPLYFAEGGKRYRSIGCECCCAAVESSADSVEKIIAELKTSVVSERSGRAQDKESDFMMQRLRVLGYM